MAGGEKKTAGRHGREEGVAGRCMSGDERSDRNPTMGFSDEGDDLVAALRFASWLASERVVA